MYGMKTDLARLKNNALERRLQQQEHLVDYTRGRTGLLGATMALIYMRDNTMTKRTCDVGSHGETFRVALEY